MAHFVLLLELIEERCSIIERYVDISEGTKANLALNVRVDVLVLGQFLDL